MGGRCIGDGPRIDDDEGVEEGQGKREGRGGKDTRCLKENLLLYLGVIRTSVKEESDTGE